MLESLKDHVYEANMELDRRGLVLYTFGNVSGIDRDKGLVAIKPSGVPYEELKPEHIVIVDLDNNIVEGTLRPSSDTRTHTYLYRHFYGIGGVCHTHSTYGTVWSQAQMSIPCFGTTHADYVYGDIPCTEHLSDEQIERDYEEETGVQIVKTMADKNPNEVPMVLVAGHAPFTWGKDAAQSVYHAVILEQLAKMAFDTRSLHAHASPLPSAVLNKHYQRKHGANAYYGQTAPGC